MNFYASATTIVSFLISQGQGCLAKSINFVSTGVAWHIPHSAPSVLSSPHVHSSRLGVYTNPFLRYPYSTFYSKWIESLLMCFLVGREGDSFAKLKELCSCFELLIFTADRPLEEFDAL